MSSVFDQQDHGKAKPVVAIINTTEESIELLEKALASEGFATVSAYVIDFKRGKQDLRTFFETYQPQVVVYDIAIPYVQNWKFFRETVLGLGLLPEQCFVVTTANRSILEVLVGPTNSIELVGRPFDLNAVVQAVQQTVDRNG